jgi:hypothetical protein
MRRVGAPFGRTARCIDDHEAKSRHEEMSPWFRCDLLLAPRELPGGMEAALFQESVLI